MLETKKDAFLNLSSLHTYTLPYRDTQSIPGRDDFSRAATTGDRSGVGWAVGTAFCQSQREGGGSVSSEP